METTIEHILSKLHTCHKVLEFNCFSDSVARQLLVLSHVVDIFRLMSKEARIFLAMSAFWKGGHCRELCCCSFFMKRWHVSPPLVLIIYRHLCFQCIFLRNGILESSNWLTSMCTIEVFIAFRVGKTWKVQEKLIPGLHYMKKCMTYSPTKDHVKDEHSMITVIFLNGIEIHWEVEQYIIKGRLFSFVFCALNWVSFCSLF